MAHLLDRISPEHLRRALTPPAFAADRGDSYERFEFLGDAVLGLAVSTELFHRFPDAAEGELSQVRSVVVSRDGCAEVARDLGLAEMVYERLPPEADLRLAADILSNERVLAALTEAVIGAAFEDLGFAQVAPEIVNWFDDRIGHAVDNRSTSKSSLQELAQRRGLTVEYEVVSADGPAHDREFTMQARIEPGGLSATGSGRTKKAAEQEAATVLLAELSEVGRSPATSDFDEE